MTVLSDAEICERIRKNELVPGGDKALAQECSYSFLPGKAFLPGTDKPAVDFLWSPAETRVVVEPGKMVWVRTRDRVKIPTNIVGFWWQTNTLSRKGLMLVNMSMVEPGYAGDLACLFVNFGSSSVIIDAKTVVAKMVFVDMRGPAHQSFEGVKTREEYDRELAQLAINQPSSFLQVGDMMTSLKTQRDEAVAAIGSVAATVETEAKASLAAAQVAALAQFQTDIPGTLKKHAGLAIGIVALLTIGMSASTLLVDWLKGSLFPDTEKVARAEAEKALGDRVVVTGTANSPENGALIKEVRELNSRIEKLEKTNR